MSETNLAVPGLYCVLFLMKQHNQFRINSRPLRQHPQTRAATVPFRGKEELQFTPQRDNSLCAAVPQTKALRQLCLLTVRHQKGPPVSCRGGGLTVQLCWLTPTCHFYEGNQTDWKTLGRGVQRKAGLSRGWTETPICLLSGQMGVGGPAALAC